MNKIELTDQGYYNTLRTKNQAQKGQNMKASGAWIRLPLDMLRDKDISITACVVYALIADRTDGAEVVQISAQELADCAGTSRRTAIRAVEELERNNYIIREVRAGETQNIRLRAFLLQEKRRGRAGTSGQNGQKGQIEQEHSYDLQDYKELVNRF